MQKKKEGYSESELPMLLQSMASLSMVVVICVGSFFFIGFMLNKYFGTGVAGIVVSTFLGAVVAMYWAYKRVSYTLTRLYRTEPDDEESGEVGEDNVTVGRTDVDPQE